LHRSDDRQRDHEADDGRGRFRHVPVVELSRLVGIVSIGDVVKYRLTAMQYESPSLREYVSAA
jgi:CBS domain-containing protein